MTVVVASCTLKQIFDKEPIVATDGKNKLTITGQLTIPEYQRPYRWTDVQIDRLFQDYRHYLVDISQSEVAYKYYLGSVILHQSEEHGCLNIIDGQQRLTTLALIAYVQSLAQGKPLEFSLSYDSPESQQQIMHNLAWLKENTANMLVDFDLENINLTLVITHCEDDAYRFFETQNTGGVRLKGPDIIKAHHLRAVDDMDKLATNDFAKKWESLGDLNSVVLSLLRGRYWQKLAWRNLPLHNQKSKIRDKIVEELAEHTSKGNDIAFGRIQRIFNADGSETVHQAKVGYDLRQPLNGGVNTIHFLQYYEQLRNYYLNPDTMDKTSDFGKFYIELITKLEGCGYLNQLFDTCMLVYISQFGELKLDMAAKKLFRVVYSRRVKNQKAVKERSVPAFLGDYPVIDWIVTSFTPEQCFKKLDAFELKVDATGLDKNSVKRRFVDQVNSYFELALEQSEYRENFKNVFNAKIVNSYDSKD